jgi:hypothetical protein
VWCLSSRAFGGQVDVPKVSSHRMWDDDCFPQSSVIIHLTNMYHARHLDFRPISGDGHQYLSIFITWTYLDTSCLRPIPPGHPRAPKGTQGHPRRHQAPSPKAWAVMPRPCRSFRVVWVPWVWSLPPSWSRPLGPLGELCVGTCGFGKDGAPILIP